MDPTRGDGAQAGPAEGNGGQDPAPGSALDKDGRGAPAAPTTPPPGASAEDASGGGDTRLKVLEAELRRARDQDAALRIKLRELTEAREAEEQRKLEAQGEFQKLAEREREKATKTAKELEAYRAAVQQRLIRQHVDAQLVARGFSPAQIELVRPGLLASAASTLKVADDLSVEGDLAAQIEQVAAAFPGVGQQQKTAPAPAVHPYAQALAHLGPGVSTPPTQQPRPSVRDQILADALRHSLKR